MNGAPGAGAELETTLLGTRGSIATPGPGTNRYGGNTSCVELVTGAGKRFIFDCGTGARQLGLHLMANCAQADPGHDPD